MTNVLDLSRNFCYNNNREVKARMTRRTRQAMASELQMPEHFVELDSQEMTYVDGGLFLGLALSAGQCQTFYNMAAAATRGLASSPAGMAVVAGAISSLFAWINGVPILGQIAFGIVCVAAITIASLAIAAAMKGTGIYAGLNVNMVCTGWFKFELQANWEFSFR